MAFGRWIVYTQKTSCASLLDHVAIYAYIQSGAFLKAQIVVEIR